MRHLRSIAAALLWLSAAAFMLLGLVAWLAPAWASESFPWRIGPFLAMTIGGWSIGTALFAADAARDLGRGRAYPLVVYLGVFGLGQAVVSALFVDRMRFDVILTWPYLVGIGTAVAGSVLAVLAWRQEPSIDGSERARIGGSAGGRAARPDVSADDRHVPGWARLVVIGFVAFVGFLSLGTAIAGAEGTIASGGVFPEAMSPFSMRAFSAFLLALAVASASLLLTSRASTYLTLARAGVYLIVPITVAAFLNLGRFTSERPLTWVYLAAYVLVGVGLVALLWRHGRPPSGVGSPIGAHG